MFGKRIALVAVSLLMALLASNVAFASVATTETGAGHASRHLVSVAAPVAGDIESQRINPFRFTSDR